MSITNTKAGMTMMKTAAAALIAGVVISHMGAPAKAGEGKVRGPVKECHASLEEDDSYGHDWLVDATHPFAPDCPRIHIIMGGTEYEAVRVQMR